MNISSQNDSNPPYATGILFYRRHIVDLVVPFIMTVVMLIIVGIALVVLINIAPLAWQTYQPEVVMFTGLALFFILSYLMTQWLFWYFDIWIVTEENLIDSQLIAFFLYNRSELSLRQIQDITDRTAGPLATLFRCGDIIIQTASKQGSFRLKSIYRPHQAVKDITDLAQRATSVKAAAGYDFVYTPPAMRLGELLLTKNLITPDQLEMALAEQAVSRKLIGQILLQQGFVSKVDLLGALSAQYHIPQVDLRYFAVDAEVARCLNYNTVTKYHLMPIHKTANGVVMVAVARLSEELVKEVPTACGAPAFFVLADEDIISLLIQQYYSPIPLS
ncbi:MAG: hypothetical protein V1807_00640 [Patescibacteria group bacterium]